MDTSVLIVGAGPTGLMLACELARRGVAVRIIDKAPAYFNGSRGKGMQPRTLEVLDNLGIAGEALANGRFHMKFRAHDGAKVLGDRDPHEGREPSPDIPYASSMVIAQFRSEEILRKKLESLGVHVVLGTELTGLEQNPDSVTATTGGSQITAQYLAACDGGRSFVRHALGVSFEGETWETERMLVGDVRTDQITRDAWHVWQSPLGFVGLCPLPSTDLFQFQAQIGPEEPDDPTLERFQKIIDERTGDAGIHLKECTWTSLFRANVRMVNRYRVGRVFLAGDAAHVHSPMGGQGMNTGIQDAFNLGWKLSAVLHGAPEKLLDTYEDERLPVAARVLGITSRMHKARDMSRRDGETLQLGISYREGPLAREERETPGSVAAGDRAPDSPCIDQAGNPIRLFDVFRGPHFTLLCFDSACAENFGPDVRVHSVKDPEGIAQRIYDVHAPTLVLVRPDGYIGLMTGDASGKSVREYLSFVLAPRP